MVRQRTPLLLLAILLLPGLLWADGIDPLDDPSLQLRNIGGGPYTLVTSPTFNFTLIPGTTSPINFNFTNSLGYGINDITVKLTQPSNINLALYLCPPSAAFGGVTCSMNVTGGGNDPYSFTYFFDITNPIGNNANFQLQFAQPGIDLGKPAWQRTQVYVSINGAEVPEPATLALFGFGLTGIGAYLRRRR